MHHYWAVKFEVEGWLANFRAATSVTTQTTHTIPPKSAMLGFLFAKIGKGRYFYGSWPETYKEYMNKVKFAVSFNNKKKVSFFDYVLYINADSKDLKPTFIEYLIWPKYTFIYLLPTDDQYLGINNKDAILNHELFKVSLGSNEAPAHIIDAKEIKVEEIEAEKIETKFILESKLVKESKSSISNNFIKEYIPISLPNQNFIVSEFIIPFGEKLSFELKEKNKIYRYDDNEFMVI